MDGREQGHWQQGTMTHAHGGGMGKALWKPLNWQSICYLTANDRGYHRNQPQTPPQRRPEKRRNHGIKWRIWHSYRDYKYPGAGGLPQGTQGGRCIQISWGSRKTLPHGLSCAVPQHRGTPVRRIIFLLHRWGRRRNQGYGLQLLPRL